MSGISDIYESTNEGALNSRNTFKKLFAADPSSILLLTDVDAQRLKPRLARLAESQDPTELSEYLSTLLDEYRPNLSKVRTPTFAYNIPAYAIKLREQLSSQGNKFWQQATIPTSLAIIIAECLYRAEADIRPIEEPTPKAPEPAKASQPVMLPAPKPVAVTEPVSASDIAARKKRWQQTIKDTLADKLAKSELQAATYTGPKWLQCENLVEISAYLLGHGFKQLGVFKESVEQRNRTVHIASHDYFIHSATGIVASIDKHVGSAPSVAYYSALVEANGTPTCFAEFVDSTKIQFKLDDVRSRFVIGRVHSGLNKAPDPTVLTKQVERAIGTNTVLGLSGFPVAPIGLDAQGHLIWHEKQGLDKRLGAEHKGVLQAALIGLPATLQPGSVEFLPRDKQAPKLVQFVIRYGEEPVSANPTIQQNLTAPKSSRPISLGKQREPIHLDGIVDEKMRSFATQWNAGASTKSIADGFETSEGNIYQIVAKLRDDATFVPRRYQIKPEAAVKIASKPKGSTRSQFSLEDISNPRMQEWAAKWNNGASIEDLAIDLGIKPSGIYEVARKLRLDSDFALRRFKVDKEPISRLQKRKARLPIDTSEIANDKIKAFADRWNNPTVSMNDLVAEIQGSQTGVSLLAAKLRAEPNYVPRKFRTSSEARDKVIYNAKRKAETRKQFDLEAIQHPAMRDWAKRWNEGEPADGLAADLGIKERSIYEVTKKLLAQPTYVAARFKDKEPAQSIDLDSRTPHVQRRTRTPISIETIADAKCLAFATDWNSGKPMSALTAEYGVGQVRIFQVASRLRSDPNYSWGTRGNKQKIFKIQARPAFAVPKRSGYAPTPAYQPARPKDIGPVTSQDIAEFQLRKQQITQDVRKVMAKALAIDLSFGEQNALADDFTDLATAENALKELGFKVSRDKSNGHLERDYSHKSGLSLTLRVRNNEDRPEFVLAFGFYELAGIPSTYENLKARAGYITKVPVQDKEHSRRVVMYRTPVEATALGQTLLEIQTCIRSGLFGLCSYQSEPAAIGPARVAPPPIRLGISPSLATLDRLLEQNGVSVEKVRIQPHVATNKVAEVATAKPIANIIITALSGEARFNLVNQLRGENKSELAEVSALINKNMETVLGECPTYNLSIIRSTDSDLTYDADSIAAKLDPNARNIVCLGITADTVDAAQLFIQKRRKVNDSSLIMGFHEGLTKADEAKLLSAGFDDIKPADEDPAILGANVLALYRRPRSTHLTESIGPLRLYWSNNALKERALQRLTIRSEIGEREVHLTGKEFRIFESLTRHKGQMRSRDQLFTALYSDLPASDAPEIKIIDVFMCKMRRKLDQALVNAGLENPAERIIDTNWGRGYTLNPNFGQNIRALKSEPNDGSIIRPAVGQVHGAASQTLSM